MKDLKKALVLFSVLAFSATAAFACDETKVETYAHPSFFGSTSQKTIEAQAKALYSVGEKVTAKDSTASIKTKKNVLVESFAKSVLDLMKNNCKGVFNPKMPILRSEMAVVLAEGLDIPAVKINNKYKDITNDYWAKSWIDKALSEGVMIGYPDAKFRPDQPITKAEVFATLAQLINVPYASGNDLGTIKGYKMAQIPAWAYAPTKEVVASKLLEEIPEPEKAAKSKYLSKEQVAYLVGGLKECYLFNSKYAKYKNPARTYINVKMAERIDAKHTNIGDTFTAKTTKAVTVEGKSFPVNSAVKGQVVEVSRPGIKNPGYIKVKFTEIKNGDCVVKLSRNVVSATSENKKNTNVVARFFAAPFSAAARVAGVAGRTGAAALNVAANGTERYGDNWSNAFANIMSLQPKASLKNVGQSFVTVGYGIYDVAKLAVSGTFGVLYEFGDEVMYLILPSKSNDSSLNVGEELVIVY